MRLVVSLLMVFCLVGLAAAQQPATKAEKAPEMQKSENYVDVLMKTSMGDITIQLDKEKAPITVANFLQYVKDGAYNGTIFHRVIPGFMIQGGGFKPDMSKVQTREPIENEWQNGLKNMRGTIAMARLGGQANSATNQFFINLVDNTGLDMPRDGAGYAVFGKVIAGMDVVDAIAKVPTSDADPIYKNKPVKPVIIESVTVLGAKEMPTEKMPAEKKTEKMPKDKDK